MKVSRPLLIGLAALVIVLAVLVTAAFTPAVQRWAVLRAARNQPGITLELDRFAATPGRFEVTGLRLDKSGVKVAAERVAGDYRLWPLLTGSAVEIDKLVARGLVIDAGAASPGATSAGAAAPAAAPALGQLELPMDITLGACDLEGRARLPAGDGGAPLEADFKITGGGLMPGREGTFQLQAVVRNGAPRARVTTLRTETKLRLTESRTRTFSRVIVASTIDAEGPGLNGPTQLRIEGMFDHTATGETYSARIDSVAGGLSDTLLAIDAKLAAGSPGYEGTWRLRANRTQVEPFYLGGDLPDFEAAGEGQLGFAPSTGHAALQGKLEVNARRFERLDPALRAIGAVRLQSEFDLAQEPGITQLRQMQVSLAAEKPVFELRTSQAITLDLPNRGIQVGGKGAGEIARVRLLGLPLAWVRPFVSAADVSGGSIVGEIALTSDGRAMSLKTVAPLRLDELNVVQDGEALLTKARLTADLEAGFSEGRWRSQLRRLELTTAAGDSLTAKLSAESAAPRGSPVSLTGEYEARLPALLQPYLEDLQVLARGELAVTVGAEELGVEKFTSRVRTLDDQPVLSTEVRVPFRYAPERKTITSSSGDGELMRVELGRIGLGTLFGRAVEGLAGTIAQGSFALESDGGGWRLRPIQPVIINGFELADQGSPAFGGVTLQAAPSVSMSAQGRFEVDLGELNLRTAGGVALGSVKGKVAQEKTTTEAAGTFQIELPALGQLPAFAAAEPLAEGRAAGEFRALFDGKDQVEARVTINGLVAREGGILLPVANISLRALQQPNGEMTVEVPVLLDRAGVRSDMNFSATLARGGAGHVLKAKLTGNQVSLEDLAAVVAVFSGAADSAPAPSPGGSRTIAASIEPDQAPPWARVAGEVGLDLKTVTYGKDWTATDLRGTLQLEPARVSLPILEAAFGERGRLEAHGELGFARGPRPYQFSGGFSVSEFDPGPFFRASGPDRPATVEGKFNVEGKFTGEGRTTGETFERTRGQFELTSRQGIFRGLRRGTEKVSVATRAVELGAALGSLFGSDKVKGAAEKVAGTAYFADQLAQEFGELKYDQLTVRLERGETLDVKLSEVALISPEVRLVGQGSITHEDGRSLLEQPLSVELNLSARGKVETLLDKTGLLLGPTSRDDLGYGRARYPVVVAGTVARPDPVSFYARLATSKLLDSLQPEN